MKIIKIIISIVFVIVLFNSAIYSQTFSNYSNIDSLRYTVLYNFYKENLIIQNNNLNQIQLTDGEILQLIGGIFGIGFIASVTVFKQDIFSTLPMSLLGASLLFLFIGLNTY